MPDTVAYVLKGWPRISELFIASEVHRVEQAGLPLRLYVIKPPDEAETHPVVDRIRTRPEYLPATTSLSATTLRAWLRENLPAFLPALRHTGRRHPRGRARASAMATAQAVRSRKGRFAWPRKLYAKELLEAVALADAPDLRHLHAPFAHGTTTVTWLCSAITGPPFSFTGRAKDIYSPSLNPAGLLRRKLLAARFAVTYIEANMRHLKTIAPEAAVHRVYHGLNADFARLMGEERGAWAPDPNGSNGRRRGAVRLLGVGRLVPKKGFDVVVDAWLYHEYRRASAFSLPCRILEGGERDGIPNVLAEAMAGGAPVVTTPVSGIPDIVRDGETGLLVERDDPRAVADAVLRLRDDRDLAERISAQARATVRHELDGERLAKDLASLFPEAIA
jgi:glycosyltransferase involved in cell wall biosynthesis